jgi:hypothetical protein
MPTTNNIVEAQNRKNIQFIASKQMPPAIATHDAFKYCAMEVRELQAIRGGLTKGGSAETSCKAEEKQFRLHRSPRLCVCFNALAAQRTRHVQ